MQWKKRAKKGREKPLTTDLTLQRLCSHYLSHVCRSLAMMSLYVK